MSHALGHADMRIQVWSNTSPSWTSFIACKLNRPANSGDNMLHRCVLATIWIGDMINLLLLMPCTTHAKSCIASNVPSIVSTTHIGAHTRSGNHRLHHFSGQCTQLELTGGSMGHQKSCSEVCLASTKNYS